MDAPERLTLKYMLDGHWKMEGKYPPNHFVAPVEYVREDLANAGEKKMAQLQAAFGMVSDQRDKLAAAPRVKELESAFQKVLVFCDICDYTEGVAYKTKELMEELKIDQGGF
ncbi:hypothetical protein UFOVP59_45 [uncultured Caudovirales phage]|uniref:Uncharacterized protein n=1 Tax=uncultured Caudovirales phage TaxID=2100421 RepID=A0A6J5KUX4_9CAUD|nr:hypothetical protein UFOVP59_45 [uncultured Caudovirales phage]CAB5221015.1 hypothetical protein UFOVP246_70 [uncultured Caudovirales phage]